MKVLLLLFFCLVLTFGSNRLSDASRISKREQGESASSENGSVGALMTVDDVPNVISFVFRTISQFWPIRLIGEAVGLPLNILLSPILDVLGMILMPVRQLLSKSLSSLAPALGEILLQLGRFLEELLDGIADTLDPVSSSASSSSTSSSPSSSLSSFTSNVRHREQRSLANILPLAMANLLRMSTGLVTSTNNGSDVGSTFFNIFNCGTSTTHLPSADEIRTDPTGSLNVVVCFIINRIINVGEGIVKRVIPSLMESLKSINETGFIPPPFSTWISTLVLIYEMGNTLRNGA